METILCPVCGEENAASLDNCQHCHQPLRQSTSELNGGGIVIDSGQSPTIKKTSELESTLPAWLKQARHGEEVPSAPPPPKAEKEEKEAITFNDDDDDAPIDDWLIGLDSDDDEDEEAADWLINLQGGSEAESTAEAPPGIPAVDEPITAGDLPRPSAVEETPIGTGELPNWVSELQSKSDSEESESLPNLFSQVESPQENLAKVDDAGTAESGELPDWLSDLSGKTDSPSVPAETPSLEPVSPLKADSDSLSISADEPLPDWMAGLQASSPAENSSEESALAESLPDWISGSDDTPPATKETLSSELDLPDWMLSDAETGTEAPASENLPNWGSGLSESSPTPTEAEADSTKSDLNDWEGNLEATTEEEFAPAVAEEEISAGDDLPDWMAKLKPAEAESAPAVAEEEISAGDDLPDWMADLPIEDAGGKGESLLDSAFEGQTSPQAFEPFVESTEEAEKADVPDWLSQLKESDFDLLTEEKAEKTSAFAESADTPDWLNEMPAIEASGADASPSPDAILTTDDDFSAGVSADSDELFGIEMPDWLSSLEPEDVDESEDETAETGTAEAESGVSGAELPSWVQAMRPVADVVPDSSRPLDEQVTGTGPLAGLSGVLPAATNLGQINKPKAHAIKLRVSESQQSSAAMLEELLANESQPSPFRTMAKTTSLPIVRWLIAVLLFLAVGASLFSSSEMVSSPNIEISEIRNVIDHINAFPTDKSVLLVFDYEAGFSGEMKVVAAPLVEQLMSRGAKLTVISTLPTGPALAENFLQETQAQYEFQTGVNYRNLGYLPGGVSGMVSFISNPRLAIPAKEDGKSIWNLAPLENIASFSNFGVVVILTNDVERGRAWVEQGSAILDKANTPLLMAISAQAEPILYPYYLSGQVDGLVSGLAGGATYEVMRNQNGLGRKYWDSYSVGLLLAEILIAIGAIINFLAALRAHRKKQKEEN